MSNWEYSTEGELVSEMLIQAECDHVWIDVERHGIHGKECLLCNKFDRQYSLKS